jgi:transcriptional regulator with GAF, ATPase, and Fis domain
LIDEHDQFYLAAQRGYPDPDRARHSTRYETGPTLRQRWQHESVFVVADTATDPRWLQMPEFDFIRSRVGVWLRVRNRTLGVLNVDSRTPNAYDANAVDTIVAFAHQAAIALENARLSAAIREQARKPVRRRERTAGGTRTPPAAGILTRPVKAFVYRYAGVIDTSIQPLPDGHPPGRGPDGAPVESAAARGRI